jgi:hypothetical protein
LHAQTASIFDFYDPLPIQPTVSVAPFTSDAGLLSLRAFDDRIGLSAMFAQEWIDDMPESVFATDCR